jgi:hypothetical protein
LATKELAVSSRQHTVSNFLFQQRIFDQKQHVIQLPYFSVSPIEDKTDTIEVIEAVLQAVLNTLTEHNFEAEFKNGRSAGNGAYMQKGKVMMSSRAIDQMGAPVQQIKYGFLCKLYVTKQVTGDIV